MKTQFLLTAAAENRLTPGAAKTGTRFPVSPIEYAEFGKYTTFQVQVRGVVGAPTNWSLSVRFVSQVANTYGVQYSNPEYVPFNELQTKTYVREGCGWGKPNALPEIANPSRDPRELITNPAYDPRPTINGSDNPAYDPRGTIINPAFDPRNTVPNSAVPRSAGDFGKIAEIGDTIAAPGYATVTRTVENFTPATRLDFSLVFEGATGGTAESPAGLIVLLNTYSWGK